jgi:hypothetical protein
MRFDEGGHQGALPWGHTQIKAAAGCKRHSGHGDQKSESRPVTLAIEAAKALAPFQSPRYSTVAIGASTVTEIKITGGMSRRDFPELPAEIPLTDESGRPTVIEAEPNGDADPAIPSPGPAAA